MPISGIYKIKNNVNDKSYIGSSVDIFKRIYRGHFSKLNRNVHGNIKLQNSFNKHGIKAFSVDILMFCDPENLLANEQHFIDTLNPIYNIEKIAGNSLGRTASDDTKRKMSLTRTGKKLNLTNEQRKEYGERFKTHALSKKPSCETKILCTTNQTEYKSQRDAADKLGLQYQLIHHVLKGRRSHTGGYKFIYAVS